MFKDYNDIYNEDYFQDVRVNELSDNEIEYLAILLAICSIPLDKAIKWLNSPEGISSVATRNLKFDFFTSIDNEITTAVANKYSQVSDTIKNSFLNAKEDSFKLLNRNSVSSIVDRFTLSNIEQYNFDKIRNLTEEMKNSVRETLWRGVHENKTVEAITEEIKQTGIKPLNGKSNAQARSAIIARTELTRARLAGRLQAFAYYGITEANVISIGDGNECEDCLNIIANNPWSLKVLAKILPAHPRCRHDEIEPVIEPTSDPIMDIDPIDVTLNISVGLAV